MNYQKFHTVTIRPFIAACKQHVPFTDGDLLFDWTAFEIPRGSARLLSATAVIRPKGDANATPNVFPLELWFADDDKVSMGTVNAALVDKPNRDILGALEMSAAGFGGHTFGANSSISVCTSGPAVDENHGNQDLLVLTPKANLLNATGGSVHSEGYRTMYIGGVAKGAFNFETLIQINEADNNEAIITTDGSSMDNTEHFAVGDTLIATNGTDCEAEITLGEAAAIAASQITVTGANSVDAYDNDDYVYNAHPIKIILAFEY
jgi:hypothetical protein